MYYIGKESFSTKKLIKDQIRRILNRGLDNEMPYLLQEKEMKFMAQVFVSHPNAVQKFGPGIKRIHVSFQEGQNLVQRKRQQRCFWITRQDGSIVDISYIQCVSNLVKSNNNRNGKHKVDSVARRHVSSALRAAVNSQCTEFRRLQPATFTCPECQKETKNDSFCAQVDHHSKQSPFRKLRDDFLVEEKLQVSKVKHSEKEGGGRQLDDLDLLRKWQEFHRKHAILRLLCVHCNQTAKRS